LWVHEVLTLETKDDGQEGACVGQSAGTVHCFHSLPCPPFGNEGQRTDGGGRPELLPAQEMSSINLSFPPKRKKERNPPFLSLKKMKMRRMSGEKRKVL